MKIRTDFVTNSSSSSFILAFKDENDLKRFSDNCHDYGYEQFFHLIEDLIITYLIIDNDANYEIPIRPIIEKLKNYNLPFGTRMELKELYDSDKKLSKYESIKIKITDLLDDPLDYLEDLDDDLKTEPFDLPDFETDEYSVYCIDRRENNDKEKALEFLRHCYTWDFTCKYKEERIKMSDFKEFREYLKAEKELLSTEEYKKYIEESLKTTDYEEKKKQVEESEFIVQGEIWDSNGGLLEWAIRNGFIEDNFRSNCIIVYNVG